MYEGVQHRILEPAQGRIGVHTADINIEASLGQPRALVARLLLREETAIIQASDDGVPPLLWIEGELRRGINIPDDKAAAQVGVLFVIAVNFQLEFARGKGAQFEHKL